MTIWFRANRLRNGVALCAFVAGCSNTEGAKRNESTSSTALADLATADAGADVNFLAQELLGRPSNHSIAIKVITDQAVEAYLQYGTVSGAYSSSTPPTTFPAGAVEVDLDGLSANSTYYYRLLFRPAGSTLNFSARAEHRFVTQRAPDATFTFDVQSDSHQGYTAFYTSTLYGVTLQNIANDNPDMLFDLGDAVSQDDSTETASAVQQKYLNQRTYFDLVGHSSSVFLVLGNHEREEGWYLDDFGSDVADTRPVLGANARKYAFLNPVPSDFYSGNGDQVSQLTGDHLRGDYYAFEWGSALFVALDPFWYTTTKPYSGPQGGEVDDAPETVGTRWDWTLGKAQYDWLAQTLAQSTKPFKFVLAHHPTGGTSDYVRGGALGAIYCEWGGYDTDGKTYLFAQKRPGWALPVHQLLVQNGVTSFIHGHDHLFAKEELNGIVYQECPQPADKTYGTGFTSNATDYAGATVFPNSGHLRYTVSPTQVVVDYVRAYLPGDGPNDTVAYSYTISPCDAPNSDGRACDDGDVCTVNDACVQGACVGTPVTCGSGGTGGANTGAGGMGGTTSNSAGATAGSAGATAGTGGMNAGGIGGQPASAGGSDTGGAVGAAGTGGAAGALGTAGTTGSSGSVEGGAAGEPSGAGGESGGGGEAATSIVPTGTSLGGGGSAPSGTGGTRSTPGGTTHGAGGAHTPAATPPGDDAAGESGGPSHGGASGSGGSSAGSSAGRGGSVAGAGAAAGSAAATGSSVNVHDSRGCGCVVARDAGGRTATGAGVIFALLALGRRRDGRRRRRGFAAF